MGREVSYIREGQGIWDEKKLLSAGKAWLNVDMTTI